MGNSPSTEQNGFPSGPYSSQHQGSRLSLKSFSTPKINRSRRPSARDASAIAAARFLAEEKLSGKSPRLVIRDPMSPQLSGSESAGEELGGLRIRVPSSSGSSSASKGGKGKAKGAKGRVQDSFGAANEMRMEYKNAASYSQNDLTLEVVSSQPLGRSASMGAIARYSKVYPSSTGSNSTSDIPAVPSRNGSTSSTSTINASRLPLSPPTIPYRSTSSLGNPSNDLSSLTLHSPEDDDDERNNSPYLGVATPASHWSESSAGGRTPPVPFATFRNSMQFALQSSKRHSNLSGSHRYSSLFGAKAGSSSPPMESQSKLASALPPVKGWVASLKQKKQSSIKKRGITVVNAERMASGRYSLMKEAAARAASARKESHSQSSQQEPQEEEEDDDDEEEEVVPPPMLSARRGSLAARLIADMNQNVEGLAGPDVRKGIVAGAGSGARRRSSGMSSSGTARRPSNATTTGSKGEVEKLAKFVAATPELAFAPPEARLFEHRPSISAMPIVTALPAGHPANHHDRFKRFNQAPVSPVAVSPSSGPISVGPASGPAPLPRARGSLSSAGGRRPSTLVLTNTSPRRSIDSGRRQSETPEGPATPRKLSNFRLSIAEPRAGEENEGERRESVADSFVDVPISRKSSAALPAPNTHQHIAPSPTPLSILSRKMSFPHSVSYESNPSPSEQRRGSYFSMSPNATPMHLPLEEILSKQQPASGVIGWGSYTVNTGPPTPDERGPVDFYGGSSLADNDDNMAPEDLASPIISPPMLPRLSTRRSVSGPAMLDLSKTASAVISSPVASSVPSDSSTPSAGSFSSTTGSLDSSRHPLTPQSAAAKVIRVDLSGQSMQGKLGKVSPTSARFTLDDLLPPTTTLVEPPAYSSPSSPARLPRTSSVPINRPPRIETEMHEPAPAPLPSPSRTRAPRPVFAEGFKLKPIERLRSESPTRKPAAVSPMSMPGMTAYFEDGEKEEEPDLPAFIKEEKERARKASEAEASEWEEGEAVLRSLSLAGISVPTKEAIAAAQPRRDTHPTYPRRKEHAPSGLSKEAVGSLTALAVEPTPKEAKRKSREIAAGQRAPDGGVVRLGAASKRGFDKREISGWLQTAQKEIAVERALMA